MRPRRALHPAASARLARPLLLALVALSLLGGVAGGLLRAGLPLSDALWLSHAGLEHAALMSGGFLGTVIAIERAVALRHRAAFIGPFMSGLAGLCWLLGYGAAAAGLAALAALAFVAVNLVVVRRQPAAHTALLLLGALAWLAGNALFAAGIAADAVLRCWFAFLVLTIAAERLEMTRLMRRRPGAEASLYLVLAALLLGAALSALLYGAALAMLALWLLLFDIARRTVFAQGLSRYMAVCLLGGYVWLALAGLAWAATALGFHTARDTALHALGLGFIVSMMMGHAPVILPAVARIKLQFGPAFYLPLALLHLSLLLRLGGGFVNDSLRAWGAGLNAGALALFALTLIGAAFAWRRRHGATGARKLP
ncbi:hypothetical protein PEC18_36445 [Paucibacter sp. O1-1]|uniref:hypothetical protein n=1 Tax=Paucibacter sp. M5-1 TaxID=3015998 RepID=UPI0021D49947|nr:hypothetical protein [Paucibacter sp. M5-1]MCU7376133.1 hypothetical protein [Paucibacter sp. O1-1]MCZ7885055.1 hypothetical protein [Paucibacter sp. M5-1]MDA3831145.1 hypothetical protein [Paucibacter sp. O1-1]